MMKKFIVLSILAVIMITLCVSVSAACDHNWRIDYAQCVAATCTERGKTVSVCSRCSQVQTVVENVIAHDFVKISGEYATCETDSTVIEKCSVCSMEKKDTSRAFGHKYAQIRRVEPTCAKEGYINYQCETCKGTKTDAIPTVAHDFSKYISSSATCTTAGQSTYQCSMCTELTLKYDTSLGHNLILSGGPTCTQSGSYTRTCSRCTYSYTDYYQTGALGHNVPTNRNEWYVVKKATCSQMGQIRAYCDRCRNYVYEDVAVLAHDYSNNLYVTKVPTASTTGRYIKGCQYCNNAIEGSIARGTTNLSAYSVPPVEASVESNAVDRGTKVSFSCKLDGVKIYYALGGANPLTSKYRVEYTEPIVITETTYVKVFAIYQGGNVTISPSEILSYTYIIEDDEPWVYFTPDAYLGGYMPIEKNEKFRPDEKATRYEVIEALDNLMLSYADDAELSFTDVDAKHADVVKKFVGAKLLNGYEDLTFRGEASIKRSELCKVLALALGIEVKSYIKAQFPDVATNHWASPYIAALTKAGYLAGDTDGNFRPEDNITRAELAVVLNRIAEVDDSDGVDIPDVDKEHWAYKYICSAVSKLK